VFFVSLGKQRKSAGGWVEGSHGLLADAAGSAAFRTRNSPIYDGGELSRRAEPGPADVHTELPNAAPLAGAGAPRISFFCEPRDRFQSGRGRVGEFHSAHRTRRSASTPTSTEAVHSSTSGLRPSPRRLGIL